MRGGRPSFAPGRAFSRFPPHLRLPGWRAYASAALNLVFPSPCRLCGQRLDHAGRLPVCDACLEAVPALIAPGCGRCGKALAASVTTELCPGCGLHPPAYTGARSAAAYAGTARELIHLLKYEAVRPAAKFWSRRLAAVAAEWGVAADVVVPVPLSRRRRRQRGFNQSEDMARGLARRLNLPLEAGLLRRVRDTRSQAGLTAEERRRNLAGAFAAERTRLAGRRVLLVDDVLTTGTTADAAAAALQRAGASAIHVLTAARADLEEPGLAAARGPEVAV